MSRRDDRSPVSGRRRFRFEREPSPKKSRRDDKPEPEKPHTNTKSDKDRDSDQRHHHRLRDNLPLKSPLAHDSKVETRTMSKDTDDRIRGPPEGTKRSSDSTKVPQSETYFQHDDRNGRSLARRTDKEHGWRRDPKEHRHDKKQDKTAAASNDVMNEKAKDENRGSRHDGYFQMKANSSRKRPAFREQKTPNEPEKKPERSAANVNSSKLQDHGVESGRHGDERRFNSVRSDDRSFTRNSRDSYGGVSSRYRGRERFNDRPAGDRVNKWKHDLYDEANKSPNPKTEQDQISKIEALLAS